MAPRTSADRRWDLPMGVEPPDRFGLNGRRSDQAVPGPEVTRHVRERPSVVLRAGLTLQRPHLRGQRPDVAIQHGPIARPALAWQAAHAFPRYAAASRARAERRSWRKRAGA